MAGCAATGPASISAATAAQTESRRLLFIAGAPPWFFVLRRCRRCLAEHTRGPSRTNSVVLRRSAPAPSRNSRPCQRERDALEQNRNNGNCHAGQQFAERV